MILQYVSLWYYIGHCCTLQTLTAFMGSNCLPQNMALHSSAQDCLFSSLYTISGSSDAYRNDKLSQFMRWDCCTITKSKWKSKMNGKMRLVIEPISSG